MTLRTAQKPDSWVPSRSLEETVCTTHTHLGSQTRTHTHVEGTHRYVFPVRRHTDPVRKMHVESGMMVHAYNPRT